MILAKENLRFRRADLRDLPAIREIEKASFKTPYSDFYMKTLLKHADVYYVAEYQGKIVGYVIARVESGNLGHIISIAVHPDFRGLGIGKALLEKAEETLRDLGCYRVYLEVRVSNRIAVNLYRKMGYVFVRVIEGYYSDGEDAYLMIKSLV